MSQQTSEIVKQFLSPAFVLQVLSILIMAVAIFFKMDIRVSTVENDIVTLKQLRIEDQKRVTDKLDRIDRNIERIVDWQIKQSQRNYHEN